MFYKWILWILYRNTTASMRKYNSTIYSRYLNVLSLLTQTYFLLYKYISCLQKIPGWYTKRDGFRDLYVTISSVRRTEALHNTKLPPSSVIVYCVIYYVTVLFFLSCPNSKSSGLNAPTFSRLCPTRTPYFWFSLTDLVDTLFSIPTSLSNPDGTLLRT